MPVIQNGLFGQRYVSDNRTMAQIHRDEILNPLRKFDPHELRWVTFFKYAPIRNMLIEISDCAPDEIDEIVEQRIGLHSKLESLARLNRKTNEELRDGDIPEPSHVPWLHKYWQLPHWGMIKRMAAERHPDECCTCNQSVECWHHPHYRDIGTDADAKVIIPMCSNCHSFIHLANPQINCGELPPAVASLFEEAGIENENALSF